MACLLFYGGKDVVDAFPPKLLFKHINSMHKNIAIQLKIKNRKVII